jgi:hypothetical protein
MNGDWGGFCLAVREGFGWGRSVVVICFAVSTVPFEFQGSNGMQPQFPSHLATAGSHYAAASVSATKLGR